MDWLFKNRLLIGECSIKDILLEIKLYFSKDGDRPYIAVFIDKLDIYNLRCNILSISDHQISFFVWDSMLLGECTINIVDDQIYMNLKNVVIVNESTIRLHFQNDFIFENTRMMCGKRNNHEETRLLLLNSNYSVDQCKDKLYTYDFDNPEYVLLKQWLDYDYINSISDDFLKAIYVMRWLHKKLISAGNVQYMPTSRSAVSYLKGYENGDLKLNCRGYAIVFNDILLSLGIPAKFIACMSDNPYDPECHITNSVYIRKYNKWIMLDAAVQTYVVDSNFIPLSIMEVRDAIIHQKKIKFMIAPHIINQNLQKNAFERYLIKNLYCFLSYSHYAPHCDDWGNKNKKWLLLPDNDCSLYTKCKVEESNILITTNKKCFFG